VNEMQLKKAPYAALGTSELAVEKARSLVGKARTLTRTSREDVVKAYDDLAKRGEKVVNRIQRSKPARRAAEGTRQASRQLKGAVTSVRKALGLQEQRRTRKAS
jgi:heparin binding hemagglutinin HbhA